VLGVGRDHPRVTVLMVIHAALSMAAIVIQSAQQSLEIF
jgi:hypothetical protein